MGRTLVDLLIFFPIAVVVGTVVAIVNARPAAPKAAPPVQAPPATAPAPRPVPITPPAPTVPTPPAAPALSVAEHRTAIDRALREVFFRALREEGFTGSYPHLRRLRGDRAEFVSVQFMSSGDGFWVQIGSCGPAVLASLAAQGVGFDQLTAHTAQVRSQRIGASQGPGLRGFGFLPPPRPPPDFDPTELHPRTARWALHVWRQEAPAWFEREQGR